MIIVGPMFFAADHSTAPADVLQPLLSVVALPQQRQQQQRNAGVVSMSTTLSQTSEIATATCAARCFHMHRLTIVKVSEETPAARRKRRIYHQLVTEGPLLPRQSHRS
ncbi:unnamed protein product [Polarella glacialis]|uniref:Uncharacterized protein n=1 Tax=Polarella glacialis TaxID=89957 RepID=A0A813L7S9_POLGL|nr:unnamed protein product [Polarella glacialis]CAE8720986.1 unnamed protein product [Polarella glacialis]